jgi:hypothetical protein
MRSFYFRESASLNYAQYHKPMPGRYMSCSTRTGSQMDGRSVRDQLALSIGFAISRGRDLLRRIQ